MNIHKNHKLIATIGSSYTFIDVYVISNIIAQRMIFAMAVVL